MRFLICVIPKDLLRQRLDNLKHKLLGGMLDSTDIGKLIIRYHTISESKSVIPTTRFLDAHACLTIFIAAVSLLEDAAQSLVLYGGIYHVVEEAYNSGKCVLSGRYLMKNEVDGQVLYWGLRHLRECVDVQSWIRRSSCHYT